MAEKINDIDAAARMGQRQLLGVLMVVLLLGVSVVLSFGLLGNEEGSRSRIPMSVMPVLIIVIVTALGRKEMRLDARTLDAMRKDELRQASLNRAYRNGFFAMLILQPPLGVALYDTSFGAAIMAAASVTLGAVTVLASLLWQDR
jgi:hypothetical protein